MSTISKKLSGFMFNGSALALGTAAFKSRLNSVIGVNAAGSGYISYNPLNAFNSLTQLAQDGVYIVDAKTLGFDIPGATLTAGIPAPTAGPLSFDPTTQFTRVGNKWQFTINPASSISTDYGVPVLITVTAPQDNGGDKSVYAGGSLDADPLFPVVSTSTSDTIVKLQIIDWRGNVAEQNITLPAVP
jgi:hypothetical protein